VLVVDDNDDTRDLLKAMFESAGAIATGAASANEALRTALLTLPDLLVADIGMPHVDGYTLIRQFREAHPQVPSIAVTAYARAEDAAQARAAGFDGYHAKEIVAPELMRLAGDVLKQRSNVA
jgi:CheY-like chemotaxis protein